MLGRLIATMMCAAALFGADRELLRYLPADATLIAGADLAGARGTPFGEYVLARVGRQAERFADLESMTGFDPRSDLLEVAMAETGTAGADTDRLVVARARPFDIPAVKAWARSKGAVVTTAGGVTMIGGEDPSHPAMAFPTESIIVFGRPESVGAALQRAASGNTPGGSAVDRLTEVSMGRHAWFVLTGSPAELAGAIHDEALDGAMQGDIIGAIEETSASFYFGPSVMVNARATTAGAADAEALANVVEFLASLAQIHADPETAALLRKIFDEPPVVAGNVVSLDLDIPEAAFERLLQRAHRQAPR